MSLPLVTVITASTGNPLLQRCMDSVKDQTYQNVQHLVFADGKHTWNKVMDMQAITGHKPAGYRSDVIRLPYSVGKDRWNGHRQYGAGTYLADGDFIIFLDDDNYLDPEHITQCFAVVQQGNEWSYSFRKIVDAESNVICNDDCESLGKWASILNPEDYFVDVNCYFLRRHVAIHISPVWFCKFREPGQPEIDRKISALLRHYYPKFDTTYQYSVNYNIGNTGLSVQKEFFLNGNRAMADRYQGKSFPWNK